MQKDSAQAEWTIVIALLLIAFALRTIGLTSVPPGLHNDEVVGIQITESVANGRAGVFFPEDTGHETLYYYVAAPFLKVLGSDAFSMRLPTVFLSMIGMCVVFSLTHRLFGRIQALTALAGLAVVFWPVMMGRAILRVPMTLPLAALAAYCFWRARSARGWRSGVLQGLSGVSLGLSINAYTAARVLPAVFAAFGLYALLWHRETWRDWGEDVGIVLLTAAVVALPLVVHLLRHPGADQLAFFDIDRPLDELRGGNVGPVLTTSLKTLGMFAFVGDPLPYYDVPGRPVLEPVGALLLVAGLFVALRRWRQPAYGFVVIWFFVALLPGMLSQPAPSYTRTIGVLVVLFALPGIAVSELLNRRAHPGVNVALVLLFIGNLAWTGYSYFVAWPAVDSVQFWHQSGLKALADQLQTVPDKSPVAVCVPDHLIDERAPWWKPARQHMRYLLDRSDLSLRYYNCADAMVVMRGPGRYAFPDVDTVDDLDRFPIYHLFLSEQVFGLRSLPRQLGFIAEADVTEQLDGHLADVTTRSTVDWAPEAAPEDADAVLPINFDDKVQFIGYTAPVDPLKPGAALVLTTYWRVVDELPPDLVQFTHMLNGEQSLVAQQDRLALSSSSLYEGDVFAQIHTVTLPEDLADGTYALSIGLYTPSDGQRLQIREAGEPRGDRLMLRTVEVNQ